MKPFPVRAPSDRAVTRAIFGSFVTLPFAIGFCFAAMPGSGLNTVRDHIFYSAMWALPLSLLTGPALALLFRKLRWGLASWTCLWIPPVLIALMVVMLALAWSGLLPRG